jgi:PAS domain S-box-containing protein
MSTEPLPGRGWQQQLTLLRSRVHLDKGVGDPSSGDALAAIVEQLSVLDEGFVSQNAELNATREAFYREYARYQELFELAPDAYVLTDLNGLICEANRSAAMLLRIDRQFLPGKPLQVFVPRRERHDFRVRLLHVREGTAAVDWHLRLMPREAELVNVAVSVAPFRDRQGAISGLRWSIRDVTDLMRKDAVCGAQEELLRRERLARAAAEAANRSKDDFLATLSHELRTPFNVVLGHAFRLKTESLPPPQQAKAVATIERNAHELSRLVDDLLDTASITNGRLTLDRHPVALAPIVQSAIDSVAGTSDHDDIRLDVNLQEAVYINGDVERLRQITWNLIANALKFTSTGGTISITVAAEGGAARIRVTDTGVGIDPSVMPHIFERFWRGEQLTTQSRRGLGLGLAIVTHLVELPDGRVTAASAGRGRGATFIVEFPIVDVAADDDQPAGA